MAEPSKPKRQSSTPAKARPSPDQPVEDAVIVGAGENAAAADNEAPQPKVDAKAETDAPDPEPVADRVDPEPENASPDAPEPDEPQPDAQSEKPDVSDVVIAPLPVAQTVQRVGFIPLVLGGAVAAALGAGAVFLAQDRGWIDMGAGSELLRADLDRQAGELGGLKASLEEALQQIAALQAAQPDGAAIDAALAALQSGDTTVRGEFGDLTETVTALRTRLEQVETQPIPKAELPAEIVAAYEAQLDDVLAAVDTRFNAVQAALDGKLAENAAMLDAKLAAIEAAQTAAAQTEQEAMKAADLAAAQAAASRIVAALDAGTGFADEIRMIRDKTGLTIPEALSIVAPEGVSPLASLQADFPDAARVALAESTRAAASDGKIDTFTAFLRTQLGARSLTPREGDDPDAILSRAEAALGQGDLTAALTEIAALPPAGQDELADWVARAQTRRDALAAAAELAVQLERN